MGKVTRYPIMAALVALLLLSTASTATTYRVGPNEKHAKVSEVSARLKPGDIVEITGDITDIPTLTVSGMPDKPVVIRGLTKVENGRILRPCIKPPSTSPTIMTCKGDWNTIEGLDISGQTGAAAGQSALILSAKNITLRNCRFHHNHRAIWAIPEIAGNTLIEFCEFDNNGYGAAPIVNLFSQEPDAAAIVQHCYFHDDTGGGMLRCCVDNTVIRYNWFENPYWFALKISTVPLSGTPEREAIAEKLLPSHADIVGNVVIYGFGPGQPFWGFSVGGDSIESPGTEGDFNFAHNLFISRRRGADPHVEFVVHGNADNINFYNNVFMEWGFLTGCRFIDRDESYDVPRTRAFAERRGNGAPNLSGANNWMSRGVYDVPGEIAGTIVGDDPGFEDLLVGSFRPRPDSPLASGGLSPLPDGRIMPLVPRYEPCRGIPTDLRPVVRAGAACPAIGPFEARPDFAGGPDGAAKLLLSVRNTGGRVAWQLPFASWRRRAWSLLSEGKTAEALACAKMQFVLSPPDETALADAVSTIRRILVDLDGNDARAAVFEKYALYGPPGEDAVLGTPDDLDDPIAPGDTARFRREDTYYISADRDIDAILSFREDPSFLFNDQDRRWYQTEKAFIRLSDGAFEDGLPFLVAALVETDKENVGDIDEQPIAQRNQDVLDRIRNALLVIARSRTDSDAGAAQWGNLFVEYARYGVAGKDGLIGTDDDIDLRSGRYASLPVHISEAAAEEVDKLRSQQSRQLADSLQRALQAQAQAQAMTLFQFDFLRGEINSQFPTGFAFLKPTPREFFSLMERLALIVAENRLTLKENSPPAVALKTAQDLSNASVVNAYDDLLASGISSEYAAKVRPYLAAFIVGINEGAPPEVQELLKREVTAGAAPTFLIEDVLTYVQDPFAAAHLFDAVDAFAPRDWPRGERNRLLAMLEQGQAREIFSAEQRIAKLPPEDVIAAYRAGIAGCKTYLGRFADTAGAQQVSFCKGIFEYRCGDRDAAAASLDAFVKKYPESGFVPNAVFLQAVICADKAERPAAIEKLNYLIKTYPQSSVFAKSLYTLGYLYVQSQQYDKAADSFQRLVDLCPNDPYAAKARESLGSLKKSDP